MKQQLRRAKLLFLVLEKWILSMNFVAVGANAHKGKDLRCESVAQLFFVADAVHEDNLQEMHASKRTALRRFASCRRSSLLMISSLPTIAILAVVASDSHALDPARMLSWPSLRPASPCIPHPPVLDRFHAHVELECVTLEKSLELRMRARRSLSAEGSESMTT